MINSLGYGFLARGKAKRRTCRRSLAAWETLEERVVLASSMVELSVVAAATPVDAQGEVANVPDDLVFVNEWQDFFVEIWASTPMSDLQDLDSVSVDLAFDPGLVDLLEIEPGAGFSLAFSPNASQAIATANVNGSMVIDASAATAGVGDDGAAIVARLAFRGDGVGIDRAVRVIGPNELGFSIAAAEVQLAPGSPETPFTPADPLTELWAIPYDQTDDDRIGFGDLALFTEYFFMSVTSDAPAMAWLSDFDKDDFVGFGDLAIFTQSFGLVKPSNVLNFAPTFPDFWRPEPLADLNGGDELGIDFYTTHILGEDPTPIADTDLVVRNATLDELTELTITIINRLDGADEILAADVGGTGLTANYEQLGSTLRISGSGTLADYQQVLGTVVYSNASLEPNMSDRVLRVLADDGAGQGDTAIAIVSLVSNNRAPDLAPIANQQARVGQLLEVNVSATDPDGDVLTFQLDEDNSPAGATIEQLTNNTAVVRFTPMAGDGPGPFPFRVIVVDDGIPSLSDQETFSVTLANPVAPIVDLNGLGGDLDFAATFRVGGPAVPIVDTDLLVIDPDSPMLQSATARIFFNFSDGADELLAVDVLDTAIMASYDDATGILALSGAETLDNYQRVLRTLAYRNTAATPDLGDRIVTVTVNDGQLSSQMAASTISFIAGNDPPNLAPIDDQIGLVNVPMEVTVTATDPDAGDVLTFVLDEDNSPAGATIEQLDNNTAIVRYTPTTADLPGPLSFRVIVIDSGSPPQVDTEAFDLFISNAAPVVDLNGADEVDIDFDAVFTEGAGPATIVDSDLNVGDDNDVVLQSATATLTNLLDAGQETLAVDVLDTVITAMYDSNTGVLSLSGEDTLANYERVLRTLSYDNTQTNPDPSDRVVQVIVDDGLDTSATATATVTLDTINDPPNLAPIDDQTVEYGQEMVLVVSATDADPGDELFFMLDEDNSPAGATIEFTPGATTATIRWTPTANDGPGPVSFRVLVVDSGNPAAADSETFAVTLVTATPQIYDFQTGQSGFPEGTEQNSTPLMKLFRSGDTSVPSTVDVILMQAAVDGAIPGVDFVPGPVTVFFAPGETEKLFSIESIADDIPEPDEWIDLSLGNFSGNGEAGTTRPTKVARIFDDDVFEELSISAVNAVAAEGDAGATAFTFLITRAGRLDASALVGYEVTGSGANPADTADFGGAFPRAVVSFADGQSEIMITINVLGDLDPEADEGFSVTLVNPAGGVTLGTTIATGTIQNDDAN
ncbi:MAG: hypothetical protein KDA42_09285 [Planctomycetales bacterium]|nr:hypothetical protein [Planctomycetales bacterium]